MIIIDIVGFKIFILKDNVTLRKGVKIQKFIRFGCFLVSYFNYVDIRMSLNLSKKC